MYEAYTKNKKDLFLAGRRGFLSQDPNQLQIDAGQKRGPTLCLTCGTVYTIGEMLILGEVANSPPSRALWPA